MFKVIEDIISMWWMIPLFASIVGFLVPWKFQNIIKTEMERGGEEFGERVVARIQAWVVLFMVLSVVVFVGMVAYWLAFDIFNMTFGN